jgi:eukaryotic-like serine/threonine-protein kinase
VHAAECAKLGPVKRGELHAGRFVLEACLGRGGMGEVWRARETATDARVALKFLREELAADADAKKRFVREARLAARVRHPNVVALLEVEDTQAQPFLVMELLVGETLGARLRRKGRLDCAELAAIALPMFHAVEAAHAAGVVHRDLKPDNVFVARDGDAVRVRVLDFGIAKQIENLAETAGGLSTAGLQTTSAMLGTPYYMAPEQALGERDVDARADLWSIGIILYECLSGKRPTEAATVGAILKIIVTDGIVPLAEQVPALDAHLADEIMDLLRSNRDERATSLHALRVTFEGMLCTEVGLELPDDEEAVQSVAAPSPTQQRGSGFRSARFVPIGIAVLAVGAFGSAFGWRAMATTNPLARANSAENAGVASAWGQASAAGPAGPPSAAPTGSAYPSSERVALLSSAAPSTPIATSSVRLPRDPSAARAVQSALAASAGRPGLAVANTLAPLATSAPAPPASLGRGPSGLVTNNPFPAP